MWAYECDSLGYQLRSPRKSLRNKYLSANLEISCDAFIDSHSKSTKHDGNQPVNHSARNFNMWVLLIPASTSPSDHVEIPTWEGIRVIFILYHFHQLFNY